MRARLPSHLLMLGVAAAWLSHVMVGAAVSILHCQRDWLAGDLAGIQTIRILISALSLGVATYVLLVTVTLRRRAATDPDARFAAFVGSLLAAIVGVYLVWATVLEWITGPCG